MKFSLKSDRRVEMILAAKRIGVVGFRSARPLALAFTYSLYNSISSIIHYMRTRNPVFTSRSAGTIVSEGNCAMEEMAEHIRAVGPKHCFLFTAWGQGNREQPVEAMISFISGMLAQKFSEDEVLTMLIHVPRQV